ncbi:MAG: hypothetical protein LBF17_01305 [Mediterranea sp.]|jgi:hypothetical protein|nr:hypothetical protein [Mediterranea sp.]
MSGQEIYKWFIVHVAYRNEGYVKNLLDIAGLAYYIPFKSVTRTWKGVKKEFQVPVIPFCAFVRVAQSDFIMLQMMKELSLVLDGEGNSLSLSDERMEVIRTTLDASENPGALVLEFINE